MAGTVNQVQRYRIGLFVRAMLWGSIAPAIFGLVFAFQSNRATPAVLLQVIGGALLSGFVASVGICGVEAFAIPALRDKPVLLSMVLRPFAYLVSLGAAILLSIWLHMAAIAGLSPMHERILGQLRAATEMQGVRLAIFAAFLGALALSFLLSVSRKLGPGVMRNWMLGRYHKPRVEERVFMFLDMKDSTPLAEQLGDLKFSALVRDFFVDITPALLETRGEVSHYIGDEAVISWPLSRGLKDSACVRCFLAVQKQVELRAPEYRKRFGLVPGFKAGLHVGQVVATEVGMMKSEIVFHGDVLNTTARIVGMCSELGRDILLSAELASRLSPSGGFAFEALGEFALKGKADEVALVGISCSSVSGRTEEPNKALTHP